MSTTQAPGRPARRGRPTPVAPLPPPFGTVWTLGPFPAPHEPDTLNGRKTRESRIFTAYQVRDWRTVAMVGCRKHHLPTGLRCRLRVDVDFRFADDPHRPTPRRDTENLGVPAKILVDGLTPPKPLSKTIHGRKVPNGYTIGYGLVVDDTPEYIDGPYPHIGSPLPWAPYVPGCQVTMRIEVVPAACTHAPRCPGPDSISREAARVVSGHPDQGWSLLCNGVVLFDDGGELRPDRTALPAHRWPAPHRRVDA